MAIVAASISGSPHPFILYKIHDLLAVLAVAAHIDLKIQLSIIINSPLSPLCLRKSSAKQGSKVRVNFFSQWILLKFKYDRDLSPLRRAYCKFDSYPLQWANPNQNSYTLQGAKNNFTPAEGLNQNPAGSLP